MAALDELNDIVGNLWSAVYNMALIQAGYTVVNSIDFWRPWITTAGVPYSLLNSTFALQALWATRSKSLVWQYYYTMDSGYRSIRSSNVYLT